MNESGQRTRCRASTRAGSQCKNLARPGSEFCYRHEPVVAAEGFREIPVEEEATDQELQRQFVRELSDAIARVRALLPGSGPPSQSADKIGELLAEKTKRLAPALPKGARDRLRSALRKDLLDAETWKGMWYMLNYTVDYQADILKRRITGEYETDEWGLDWEFVEAVRPFLDFLYKVYWRVEVTGIEQVPDYDRALLVSNQSGHLPWPAAMIMAAILNEHPAQRLVRSLHAEWLAKLPFLSAVLLKTGQAVASVENGRRLLEQDELVAVFPESYRGEGNVYKERYRLARFGRGEAVKMALLTGSPIVPVSVVGAEEATTSLAKSSLAANLSALVNRSSVPWLGLTDILPLPTRWYIDFGEPVSLAGYGPDDAFNQVLVAQTTDEVREVVQQMVVARLKKRESVFR